MARSEFVVKAAKRDDKARTRKVVLASNNKLVGYICERDGKGAGYYWKLPWMTYWNGKGYTSLKHAVLGMGARI